MSKIDKKNNMFKNISESLKLGNFRNKTIDDEDEVYPTNADPVSTQNLLTALPQNRTPYDYFRMIFTDSMIQSLTSNANQGPKTKKWKILDKSELLTAVGLYLHTGSIKMKHLTEYWSSDEYYNGLVTTCFPLIMGRDRFINIMKSLFNSTDNHLYFVSSVLDIYNERMDDILEDAEPKLIITGLSRVARNNYVELSMVIDENAIPSKYLITDDNHKAVQNRYYDVLKTFKKTNTIQWPPEIIKVISGQQNEHQLLSFYPININMVKYYQKIGFHLFHIILMSSYYLYNSHENNKLNLHEYRLSLFHDLFRIESSHTFQYQLNLALKVTSGHFPIKNNIDGARKFLRCRNCSRNKKSRFSIYHCSGCSGSKIVGLCLQCFEEYHYKD